MVRRTASLFLILLFAAASSLPVGADVLKTTDGLVLEGAVTSCKDGTCVIETVDGTLVVSAEKVASVTPGDGPRTLWAKKRAKLATDDAVGLYQLALRAEAEGLPDLARQAHEGVVTLVPDHAASRRALRQEKVDGRWVSVEVARRRRGLVLFEGKWMLPGEVETTARTKTTAKVKTPSDEARTRVVIRTWATAEEPLRRAARIALASVPNERLLRALTVTLYDAEPKVRAASARLLGELGDEAALRPLIFSGARDMDADVRREAVLAAASFGHDDVAIPFIRALGSDNLRLAANGAEALAAIGDQRSLGFIVRRVTSHGGAARAFVAFIGQISYVRDYDVEIAQASNIANPDVGTIIEGVILDVHVLDASYTKTWIEPILVGAAGAIAGRDFADRGQVLAWYAEEKDNLPSYPEAPGRRKRQGSVIGAVGR